jgi:SWI/SNF-related matrix-associated actin-dependent regulator of chromatin subfamily A3
LDLQLDETDQFTSQGSRLADDMGLGKTLTSLALVLATSHLAKQFQMSSSNNHPVQSSATLIICPLATLSNWENEIKIHFDGGALPYCIFHGRDQGFLLSSLVVLTTYKMVGTSGNPLHTNQITIESLDICWFRNSNCIG